MLGVIFEQRLTLVIVLRRTINPAGLHIGQQTLDPLEIGVVNNPGLAQISFPLGALLGEDMAGKSLAAYNLAGASAFEPLGSPSVCFHLRHGVLPL
jgi:hypothetical protein